MDWYKLFAERFRKDLHIKINSIYLIDSAKRFTLIEAVNKIENIEDLMEIDTKIDAILQQVWEISIKLLDWADPTILTEFYANLKKLISQTFEKRNVKELLELKEIEINI